MNKDVTLKTDTGDNLYPITRAANVFTSSGDIIENAINEKQPLLTPGANITIDKNNVISATGGGTDLKAGNGISISSDDVVSLAYDLADELDIDNIFNGGSNGTAN